MLTIAYTPPVGAKVRHPLWPELGTGVVETSMESPLVVQRTGWVQWSCGQRSRHNLSVLREVDA